MTPISLNTRLCFIRLENTFFTILLLILLISSVILAFNWLMVAAAVPTNGSPKEPGLDCMAATK